MKHLTPDSEESFRTYLMDTFQELQKAFNQGVEAGVALEFGTKISNPYKEDSPLHEAWQKGYES